MVECGNDPNTYMCTYVFTCIAGSHTMRYITLLLEVCQGKIFNLSNKLIH